MRGSVRVHVRVRSCAYARVRTCARPCERTLSMVSRLPSWIGRSIQLGKAHPTWLQALYLCVRLGIASGPVSLAGLTRSRWLLCRDLVK